MNLIGRSKIFDIQSQQESFANECKEEIRDILSIRENKSLTFSIDGENAWFEIVDEKNDRTIEVMLDDIFLNEKNEIVVTDEHGDEWNEVETAYPSVIWPNILLAIYSTLLIGGYGDHKC